VLSVWTVFDAGKDFAGKFPGVHQAIGARGPTADYFMWFTMKKSIIVRII